MYTYAHFTACKMIRWKIKTIWKFSSTALIFFSDTYYFSLYEPNIKLSITNRRYHGVCNFISISLLTIITQITFGNLRKEQSNRKNFLPGMVERDVEDAEYCFGFMPLDWKVFGHFLRWSTSVAKFDKDLDKLFPIFAENFVLEESCWQIVLELALSGNLLRLGNDSARLKKK